MLIEDNRADALLVREMLETTGLPYELTMVKDGEKAIEFFERGSSVDFVILDLNLPRVHGHAVMRFLKDKGITDKTDVVVMTGSTSPSDLERVRENGAVSYITKPMSLNEIERTSTKLKLILSKNN